MYRNEKSGKSSIVTTLVVLLVCLVLVTGSTFSLFTSKTGTNIAVTSGNVEMVATIDASTLALYSKGIAQTDKFANGGTASFNEAKTELTLTNITPGDSVEFDIVLENKSNVDIQYRVNWIVDGDPAEALVATVDGADITSGTSEWTPWEADAAEKTQTLKITVELPLEAGSEHMNKAANIAFNVEAVQGNAGTYVELNEGDDLLAALAAADADYPLTIKLNGNVEWPTEGHHGENNVTPASSITIDGNGYTITATGSGVTPLGDTEAPMTLKNVKIVDNSVSYNEGAWEFTYLEMGGTKLTCENVTFADEIQLGTNATFTNCSFESNEASVYAVWVENGSATFTNCTFTGYRGLKAHEAYGSEVNSVVVKGCTFDNITKKPGIALGTLNADTTVSITDSSFINCQAGDQGLYMYETDRDVTTIKFTNENNKVTADVADATQLADMLANAKPGTVIALTENVNYGTVTVGELEDVVIKGAENTVLIFKTDANTKIKNVTLEKVAFEYTGATADCGIVIDANAQIDNLVVDGCTFTGTGAKAGRGLSGLNANATIVLKNCTFKDLGYPIYAWGSYASLTIDGCTFDNIKSRAIMPQSGFNGDLTVNNCNFVNCIGGGLIKAGTLTAGHTFTFTNNTVTGCTIAGDHNWFQFNVSAGTVVLENNTMDGQPWTPTSADGLK